MSISNGFDQAMIRGKKAGCQVIQVFTRNTSRWDSRALSLRDIDAFHRAREETSIEPVAGRVSYLINLASSRGETRSRSLNALMEEVDRAKCLGIPYLVMHPGSHTGDGEETGIQRIAEGLKRICDKTPDCSVKILLETTAGQGSSLGHRFEHLAEIMSRTDAAERLGICLDTCHVFAAGYDFRRKKDYSVFIREFNDIIGLEHLKLLHINDSKKHLDSRVDRHEHLGHGCIGQKAFSFLLKDPHFRETPFIIETPKGKEIKGVCQDDVVNLNFLKHLMEE